MNNRVILSFPTDTGREGHSVYVDPPVEWVNEQEGEELWLTRKSLKQPSL